MMMIIALLFSTVTGQQEQQVGYENRQTAVSYCTLPRGENVMNRTWETYGPNGPMCGELRGWYVDQLLVALSSSSLHHQIRPPLASWRMDGWVGTIYDFHNYVCIIYQLRVLSSVPGVLAYLQGYEPRLLRLGQLLLCSYRPMRGREMYVYLCLQARLLHDPI